MVTEPALLLADEPTGNLDSERSEEVMNLLVRFNRDRGVTIVMVTHEPDMAAFAGRTIRFVDGHVESDSINVAHAAGGPSRTREAPQDVG
jgi:putative ABC transport system ATP-binding protein